MTEVQRFPSAALDAAEVHLLVFVLRPAVLSRCLRSEPRKIRSPKSLRSEILRAARFLYSVCGKRQGSTRCRTTAVRGRFYAVHWCSALFEAVQICAELLALFNAVQCCSALFKAVQSCSTLCSVVQRCSKLLELPKWHRCSNLGKVAPCRQGGRPGSGKAREAGKRGSLGVSELGRFTYRRNARTDRSTGTLSNELGCQVVATHCIGGLVTRATRLR